MSKSKDKGTRYETWLANHLTESGIPSERCPGSGALGGKYDMDVVIGTPETPIAKIECKHREAISKQFWEWLDGDDFLAIKRNRMKPLVVMPLDTFVELVRMEHRCQQNRLRVRKRVRGHLSVGPPPGHSE